MLIISKNILNNVVFDIFMKENFRNNMQTNIIPISVIEKDVIEKLLGKDNKINYLLRKQYAKALVDNRWFSGKGFFTSFNLSNDQSTNEIGNSFYIDVVGVKINNIDVGFVLFIEKGKLKTLEGFTYYGDWPTEITNYTIFHEK